MVTRSNRVGCASFSLFYNAICRPSVRLQFWFIRASKQLGENLHALDVGARVYWRDDKNDLGTVTEKDWAGVTVKWDNRSQHSVLHNDMVSKK
jgi:hypothetical protein